MARRRDRRIAAVAVSVLAHVIVLAIVAIQAPMIATHTEEAGPPVPIIPVLLMPKTPPSPAGGKPAPIRLHRRPQRFVAPPPIAPLPVPPIETPSPAKPAPAPVVTHPAPLPGGPKADVRAALRAGPIGCANADAVSLSKAERDLCNEQLGKGAKSAPFVGLGLSAEKQGAFDRVAGQKEADRRYRERPALPGDPYGGSTEPWRNPGAGRNAPPDLPRLPP